MTSMIKLFQSRYALAFILAGLIMCGSTTGTTTPAIAADMTLQEARQQGILGERYDGTVAPVNPPVKPSIREMVERINKGRARIYKQTARKQGTDLEKVKRVAGQKIINALPPGSYYLTPSGKWERK